MLALRPASDDKRSQNDLPLSVSPYTGTRTSSAALGSTVTVNPPLGCLTISNTRSNGPD